MANYEKRLRKSLKAMGFSDDAVGAAWPTWWSSSAESSPSAVAELRFSIARRLGLDPRSIGEDREEPIFIWKDEAKFKNLSSESEVEKAALASFGMSVAQLLTTSLESEFQVTATKAGELRKSILKSQPFVRLLDLVGTCWGIGIPVIYLDVFPLRAKRMHAMTVRIGDRYAILLGKDAKYPPWTAFYLAHELGHIFSGHLMPNTSVVDLDLEKLNTGKDVQEVAADRFALELLTGHSDIVVVPNTDKVSGKSLASLLVKAAERLQVEAGTLALCYGHKTGKWDTANKALSHIYTAGSAKAFVNGVARENLDFALLSDGASQFLNRVMG